MKLDRTEISVLVVLVLAIVTVNSWYRVKAGGRRRRAMIEALDASLVDGAIVFAAPADAGRE